MKFITCIFLLIFCSIASAAVTTSGIPYPGMDILVNKKNHESLWIHCHQPFISGSATLSKNIKCRITKIGVIHKKPFSGSFLGWLTNLTSDRKQTCYMFEADYKVTFHYSKSQSIWIWRDTKPYGICGIMQTGYLTRSPKTNKTGAGYWNYTEHSLFTKTTGYFCSKVHAYSSHFYGLMNIKHYGYTHEVNCKYMDLSESMVQHN